MSDPCTPVTTTSADGARITWCAYGGQLLGWVPAGSAVDRLWLSPAYGCGGGRAIRGGIPVVWPQFADRGPLPKHGFARDRAWTVVSESQTARGPAEVAVRLIDDEQTLETWPHRFALDLAVQATGAVLGLELTVTNTGESEFAFIGALHTYLRVGAAAATTIDGLGGLDAQDNARDRAPTSLPDGRVEAIAMRDVAVLGVTGPVQVDDPHLGTLTIEADGFPDRVLWNPGPQARLGDVPDGAYAEFVCVEPAVLTPVGLAPGSSWRASVTITAD